MNFSLFPLLKSLSVFLFWLFTHLPFYLLLFSAFVNAIAKSLIVPVSLTKSYFSLGSLVVLFLCMSCKFTFNLSDWHLLHFLSFSFPPLLVNIIYFLLQVLLWSHVHKVHVHSCMYLLLQCRSMYTHLSGLQQFFSEVRIPALLTG